MQNIIANKTPKNASIRYSIVSVVISFILLSMSIFYQPMTVYASGEQWTDSEKVRFFGEGFFKICTDVIGVIFPSGSDGEDLQDDFVNYVLNNDWIQNNMTYDEWIASNLSINYQSGDSGNADVSYSVDLQNAMIDWANEWIVENTGFQYVYSYNAAQFLNKFNEQNHYHEFLELVEAGDNYYIAYAPSIDEIRLIQANGAYIKNGEQNAARPNIIPTYNWNNVVNTRIYEWDNSESTYVLDDESSVFGIMPTSRKNLSNIPNLNYSSYYLLDLNTTQYLVYNTLDSLKAGSEGVQEYYVTDNYTTQNVSNVKTTTTNNIDNSISYNNVQNWVNNYYVQNTTYPSSNDVYNYINNYDGSGGGSGGGGSGSDDDDNGFDWGFLGSIGDFLKGLLSALSSVISGILDVLTGVIDLFIGEEQPDGTRSGGIPTIIGKLVAHFLPMLPAWCTQLIGFSVLLSLILGIIKLIRGH